MQREVCLRGKQLLSCGEDVKLLGWCGSQSTGCVVGVPWHRGRGPCCTAGGCMLLPSLRRMRLSDPPVGVIGTECDCSRCVDL